MVTWICGLKSLLSFASRVTHTCQILSCLPVVEVILRKAPNLPFVSLEVLLGAWGGNQETRGMYIMGEPLIYSLFSQHCCEMWCKCERPRKICPQQQSSHQTEKRDALHGVATVGSIQLCSWKEVHMYTGPGVWSFPWHRRNQEPKPNPSLTIFPATQGPLRVCNPQAWLPIFLPTLSIPHVHNFTQGLSRPRSPQLGEEASLCEVAPLLCKVGSRAVEEAGHSYCNAFYGKENRYASWVCFSATAFWLVWRKGIILKTLIFNGWVFSSCF